MNFHKLQEGFQQDRDPLQSCLKWMKEKLGTPQEPWVHLQSRGS